MNKNKLMELIDSNGRFNLPTTELEHLADYLIANGVGDITAEKHRADVAEEALRNGAVGENLYCSNDDEFMRVYEDIYSKRRICRKSKGENRMSRDLKKSRIYYDTKGVKAYDKMMTERYKNRKNPDNILPEGITDAEFRKAIIDIFCGVDWFISYPGSQTQVNEEAIETIIESITNKSAAKRLEEKKE